MINIESDLFYHLYVGDARDRLKELDDNSVHLVVTSPPYGQIKEYSGRELEIGNNQSVDRYHQSLIDVWREVIRVLHPGCRLVINIGDEFVKKSDDRPYHILPHNSMIIYNLLENFGEEIVYNGTILWSKVTTSKTSGGGKVMGSVFTPRDGHFFVNYEHVMVFKKIGKGPAVEKWRRALGRFTIEERRVWFQDKWKITPERQNGHIAMFPIELPERLIKMYSFPGEVVLDPFVGSGTTIAAAAKNNRSAIGIELGFGSDDSWKKIVDEKLMKYLGKRELSYL